MNLEGEDLLLHLTDILNKKGYGCNMVKYDPIHNAIVWHGSFDSRFEICYNRLILHGAKLHPVKDEWTTTVCIVTNLASFENACMKLENICEPADLSHVNSVDETFSILKEDYAELIKSLQDVGIMSEVDLIDCVAKVQPVDITKVYEGGRILGYVIDGGVLNEENIQQEG